MICQVWERSETWVPSGVEVIWVVAVVVVVVSCAGWSRVLLQGVCVTCAYLNIDNGVVLLSFLILP